MGKQKVEVYKGRSNGCLWMILLPIFGLCFIVVACMGTITAALAGGLISECDVREGNFASVLEGAESARVEIVTGIAEINITPLTDSNNLFEADIRYCGEVDFSAGGDDVRTIRLEQVNTDGNIFGTFNIFGVGEGNELVWNIGLAEGVPIDLDLESGIDNANLDLSDVTLAELTSETGVGEVVLSLPNPVESYDVNLESGVGDITINLPEGAAVRVEADLGIGDIDAANLTQISGDGDGPGSQNSVWESDNYAEADERITILINGGVGDITIR